MPTTTTATKRQQRQPPHVFHPQAGDLIFVRPAPDDRVGQLVARATNGPYCHLRIRLSSDMLIEALARQGVVRSFVQIEPDAADVAAIGASLDADRLTHALAWLIQQEGHPYSGWDIAADIAQALVPARLSSRTPFLAEPSAFDCAELGARFLIRAGYRWLPDDLLDCPQRTSPNSIARALGILKG